MVPFLEYHGARDKDDLLSKKGLDFDILDTRRNLNESVLRMKVPNVS